eukprot:1191231-Pyramimonas_sp.AAC.1
MRHGVTCGKRLWRKLLHLRSDANVAHMRVAYRWASMILALAPICISNSNAFRNLSGAGAAAGAAADSGVGAAAVDVVVAVAGAAATGATACSAPAGGGDAAGNILG